MARTKNDLLIECNKFQLDVNTTMSKEELMDRLMEYHCAEQDILPQIDVMLCRDAKEFLDYSLEKPWESQQMKNTFWSDPNWIAENKVDGCRFKMHITPQGIRLDSRRRSDKNYAYSEKTANFPQFSELSVEGLPTCVLDGEIFMPVKAIDTGSVITDSCLNATVAIANSSPERSIPLQEKYGWAGYYCFDIMKGPNNIACTPFRERARVATDIANKLQEMGAPINMTKAACGDHKQEFFEQIMEDGGEGVVFKHLDGFYRRGKRPHCQYKLKKFSTVDCFITGYIPGEHGNTGLVGALCVSVIHPTRGGVEIGAVSGFTMELRKQMSCPDGSLKAEYYNRVVECRYQELTKTHRMRHATLFRWRLDKNLEGCTWDQME